MTALPRVHVWSAAPRFLIHLYCKSAQKATELMRSRYVSSFVPFVLFCGRLSRKTCPPRSNASSVMSRGGPAPARRLPQSVSRGTSSRRNIGTPAANPHQIARPWLEADSPIHRSGSPELRAPRGRSTKLIEPQHAGLWIRKPPAAFQHREVKVARRRAIVQ